MFIVCTVCLARLQNVISRTIKSQTRFGVREAAGEEGAEGELLNNGGTLKARDR